MSAADNLDRDRHLHDIAISAGHLDALTDIATGLEALLTATERLVAASEKANELYARKNGMELFDEDHMLDENPIDPGNFEPFDEDHIDEGGMNP